MTRECYCDIVAMMVWKDSFDIQVDESRGLKSKVQSQLTAELDGVLPSFGKY